MGTSVFRAPKTAKSQRLVALPPSAALVLRDHLEEQETDREVLSEARYMRISIIK